MHATQNFKRKSSTTYTHTKTKCTKFYWLQGNVDGELWLLVPDCVLVYNCEQLWVVYNITRRGDTIRRDSVCIRSFFPSMNGD
jgi:hypothetical protein